jgi:hypothetical protein
MGDGGGHGGREVDWILDFVLSYTVCLRYFMCFLAIFCDILSWTKIQEM